MPAAKPRPPFGDERPVVRVRILGILILAMVGLGIQHRLTDMDRRFFRPSPAGLEGLARYWLEDYRGAAQAYRKDVRELLRRGATSADPAYDALLAENWPEAERLAGNAVANRPLADSPRLILATAALLQGQPEQVIEQCRQVLERDDRQVDAWLLSAVARTRLHQYGDAIDALNGALRTGTTETNYTSFLAALEVTGELTRLRSGERPWCLLAHYHRYLRIFDPAQQRQAVACAKQAIRTGDRPDDAYLTIGIIHSKAERREEALQSFRKAIEINPNNAEARRWAFTIYSQRGDLARAYEMIRSAVAAAPKDRFYTAEEVGFLTAKLGDYQSALELARQRLVEHSEDPAAADWVAYLYQQLGEHELAVEFARGAAELNPLNANFQERIAFNLKQLQRYDGAIAAYERALSLDLYRASAHEGLADIYHAQRRYSDAVREQEIAYQLGSQGVVTLCELCNLYFLVAEYDRSTACFKRVLAIDPQNPKALHLLPYVLQNITPKTQ